MEDSRRGVATSKCEACAGDEVAAVAESFHPPRAASIADRIAHRQQYLVPQDLLCFAFPCVMDLDGYGSHRMGSLNKTE